MKARTFGGYRLLQIALAFLILGLLSACSNPNTGTPGSTSNPTGTSAGIITTVAGNGTSGYSGDGGPATLAQLTAGAGDGIAVDSAGNIYVADYTRIRKVSTSGIITTVAGNGTLGFSGDGGPATSAKIYSPGGMAVDSTGSLYFADWGNHRVRNVSTSGTITTVAGNGTSGFSGDGGPATSAMLNPGGVAFDASGNLYIASWPYVRKVSLAGTITTVAGGGAGGDGGPATSALLNNHFVDVTVDSAGNFYISEDIKGDVRKINTAGIISTVAGTGISGYSGDGGPATGAGLNTPLGLAVDATGNLYIADQGNLRVRKVSTTGTITTVAGNGTPGFSGDGGPATSAETYGPEAAAIDAAGNLYFVDQGRVRKVVNP